MKNGFMKKSFTLILVICLCIGLFSGLSFGAFAAGNVVFTGIDTLMIYNPLTDQTSTMSTGSMLGQIDTNGENFLYSEAMENEEFYFADHEELLEELDGIDLEDIQDDLDSDLISIQSSYSVGSKRTFYYMPGSSYTGKSATFTCLYDGTYCQVWGYGYSNTTIAAAMGQEFDTKIYQNDTEYFGTARYMQDGVKLNILIYTMNNKSLCGYFRPIELLTASEMGSYYASRYNSGEPIIHLNSTVCTLSNYKSYGLVTIAHEFQHLISFSSTLLGNGYDERINMGTWLNEAMSMEAEEINYPGEVTKMTYISKSYNGSGDIAGGQSLYDFSANNDIGIYGQGYMFAEYLKEQYGGTGVFTQLHNYWRTADASKLSDAEAIYNILPSSTISEISNIVSYPDAVENSFNSDADAFLSKLDLSFQIATAIQDSSGIYSLGTSCGEAAPKIYTGTSCLIPGGGRVYVQTNDGDSYTVPDNADSRLIYVGFKEGEVVIQPTTAEDYGDVNDYVLQCVQDNTVVEDGKLNIDLLISIPEKQNVKVMVGAYKNGQMKSVVIAAKALEYSNNAVSLKIDYDENYEYKVFVVEADSLSPLLEPIIVNMDSTGEDSAG